MSTASATRPANKTGGLKGTDSLRSREGKRFGCPLGCPRPVFPPASSPCRSVAFSASAPRFPPSAPSPPPPPRPRPSASPRATRRRRPREGDGRGGSLLLNAAPSPSSSPRPAPSLPFSPPRGRISSERDRPNRHIQTGVCRC